MNEPYFQVGEEVIVIGAKGSDFDGDAVVIDILEPFIGRIENPRSPGNFMVNRTDEAIYWTSNSRADVPNRSGWSYQSSLRKKHKPSTQSFSNLITNIEPIEV